VATWATWGGRRPAAGRGGGRPVPAPAPRATSHERSEREAGIENALGAGHSLALGGPGLAGRCERLGGGLQRVNGLHKAV
jgi:hypothetical protein